MGIRSALYGWLHQGYLNKLRQTNLAEVEHDPDGLNEGDLKLNIKKAANGRLLTVQRFKSNPHGPDWTTILYLVPTDTSLIEMITKALVKDKIVE